MRLELGYYRATNQGDRAKAIAAVAVVHIVLAAVILSGLNVRMIAEKIDALQTFDVREPPAPPPQPPPPMRQAQRAREKEGAAGKKADPTVIVAPTRNRKSPVTAALIAGTGSAASAGATSRGTGTGAGGSGSGRGGGGAGDFSGYTPAQRITRIPNSEYRRLVAASGSPTGIVGITLKVNTDGRPSNCRIVRTSGNSFVDALMCELALSYVRFRPARDADGRPVAQDVTWYPDWAPN